MKNVLIVLIVIAPICLTVSQVNAQTFGSQLPGRYSISAQYQPSEGYTIVESPRLIINNGRFQNQRTSFSSLGQPLLGDSDRRVERQEIRSMPIYERPDRPFHIYGNTVRRNYYYPR